MKRLLLLGLGFSVLLTACTGLQGELRVGPVPGCDTTSRGRLLLMAQSVPDASMIPCFGELPPGWNLTGSSTQTSFSRLVVTSDVFDLDVEVLFAAECDIADAEQTPSDWVGVDRYLAEEGRTVAYVFEGGCLRVVYATTELAASPEGQALIDEIQLMTRDDLRSLSGWEL